MSAALLASLERALAADPGNHELRCHLADLLVAVTRPDEALAHARRVLEAVPDHPRASLIVERWATREPADPVPVPGSVGTAGTSPRWEVIQPDLTLEEVAGAATVTARLERMLVAPLASRELQAAFRMTSRSGPILYGPPGCGKALLARALSGQLGRRFVAVDLPGVLDEWRDEHHGLHAAFVVARATAPAIMFLDGLDALGHGRHTNGSIGSAHGAMTLFLAELDAIDDGVLVIGATSRPWDLDPALRRTGRFGRMVLVPPPDAPARTRILTDRLEARPTSPNLDLDAAAAATSGFSCSDLGRLADTATEAALAESIDGGVVEPISQRHLAAALHEVRGSAHRWFRTATTYATFANDDGTYDDLLHHAWSSPP